MRFIYVTLMLPVLKGSTWLQAYSMSNCKKRKSERENKESNKRNKNRETRKECETERGRQRHKTGMQKLTD